MNKRFSKGAYVVLDFGLMSLCNFLISIFLSKSISPQMYSYYVLGLSLIFICLSFHRALVIIPFTVLYPKSEGEDAEFLEGVGFFLTLGLIFLSLLLFYIYIFFILSDRNLFDCFGFLVMLYSGWFAFHILREHIRFTNLGTLNIGGGYLLNITSSTFIIIAVYLLYENDTLTLEHLFYCLIIGSLIPVFVTYFCGLENTKFPKKGCVKYVKQYWDIARWNILYAIFYSISSFSLPWLLLHYSEKKSVAAYGVCMALTSMVSPLVRGVNGYLFPVVTHSFKDGDMNNLWNVTKSSTLILTAPFIVWLFIIFLFGDSLLEILYSSEYAGYKVVLLLLALKSAVESISSPLNSALLTVNKVKVVTWIQFVSVFITLTLGIYLIKQYGLLGAGVVALVASFIVSILKYYTLYRYMHTELAR